MQYEKYKLEDFLYDEFFVRWVKNPGPETIHFWETWIEKNPDRIQVIKEAREIITSVQPKHQYKPPENTYNEVLENVLKQQSSWTQLGYFKKNDRLTSMVKYAAILLLIVGFGGVIIYLNEHVYNHVGAAPKLTEKISPFGKKLTFLLEDGTRIKLNAGSKLVYPESFGDKERCVRLEGEAYFEVKRDETRPFIVETNSLTTIVLGTSFTIKSYNDDPEKHVAVATGKVKVMKSRDVGIEGSEYLLLEKNQMVKYSANSFAKLDSIPDEVFAWKDNIIIFNHTEFHQVLHRLERWYGVEFKIDENREFPGLFTTKYDDQLLQNVLEGLKDQYDFQYKIGQDEKHIVIY